MVSTEEIHRMFKEGGMVGGPGIQINIPVGFTVNRKAGSSERTEAPYCDHHCAEEGKYLCPAAFYTVDPKTFAPAEQIVEGIRRCSTALTLNRELFLEQYFSPYAAWYKIPDDHARALKRLLRDSEEKIDVNLFGGEPAWHPKICNIASELKKEEKYTVILTTTGSPMIKNDEIRRAILSTPFDTMALSVDGLSSDRIRELSAMAPVDTKKEWKEVHSSGAEKKAYEAMYAAKLAREKGIRVMFNIVVHPGNLDGIYEMMDALDESFQGIQKNPYLAQSSFYRGNAVFDASDVEKLGAFINYMLEEQMGQIGNSDKRFVPRAHYWFLQKAVYETLNGEELLRALSGYDVWRCYNTGRAGSYIQIGDSSKPNTNKIPGGHLGCFWNDETITVHEKQVWVMEQSAIDNYITGLSAIKDLIPNPCPGCIMPRLMGNLPSMETGMDQKFRNKYLEIRRKEAGF
jgi:organic radical activating enzyme